MPYKRNYSKYNNKKTEIDGIMFDSKKEARRYGILILLQQAGEISNLQLQPKFNLQPKFRRDGKGIREINYIADFMYEDKNGAIVVEDVKGMKTDVYKIKYKMFIYKYPQYIFKEI